MAGIGFELKKILRRDTYSSEIKAYLYSALISSGPWVLSVSCIALLGLYRFSGIGSFDYEVFRATVTCTFAFSLIFVGIFQLVVTRYLADRFYAEDERITLATFITSSVMILCGGVMLSVPFYMMFPLSLGYKMLGVILFEIICGIWMTMIFIAAVKNYNSIVYAFAAGVTVSIGGALLLGKYYGLTGYLLGYTIGQAVILFWLISRLLVEFPLSDPWNAGVFRYFRKYWDLMAAGFIFNLAIWVDKFVFWAASDARTIMKAFITHDLYEPAVFYSYLTIVPTLAIFLIRIETDFYDHYRSYYARVTGKAPLSAILQEKEKMATRILRSIRDVFVVQGGITLICMFFAPELCSAGGLTPLHIPLLRVSLIGSFLMALFTITVIVLYYFDLRRRVLLAVTILLVLNTLLSFFTTLMGIQYYGYGFTYAYFFALLMAFYMLYDGVKNLEYITFARQPV